MKILKTFMLLGIILFFFSCTPSRILRQTGDTAIIQGLGPTKIEAKLNAEDEAKKLFIKYSLTKEPEYTQEHQVDSDDDGNVSGGTYWSCVIEVKNSK